MTADDILRALAARPRKERMMAETTGISWADAPDSEAWLSNYTHEEAVA